MQVTVGNLRPENVGAFTQNLITNVGTIAGQAAADKANLGSNGASITNGVVAQTITIGVGTDTPRTIDVAAGATARDISDAINRSGAAINSRATTTTNVYIENNNSTGELKFKLSRSGSDIQQQIDVTPGAGSKAAALASQVNAGFPIITSKPLSRPTHQGTNMSNYTKRMATTS